MAALRELLATFGLKVDDKQVKGADRTLSSFTNTIKKVGAAIGVFFVARGLKQMIGGTINAANEIADLSSKLGIGAGLLQEYQFAAEKTGVPIQALNMGLQRFIRRTAEAAMGTGSALKTLQKLRIELKNDDGTLRSTELVMNDVADAIMNTSDEQERLRIAFALFDSEGVALVNTLKGGAAGLEAFRKEARELGGIMSDELLAQSEAAKDEMQELDEVIKGIKNDITLALVPAIRRGIVFFRNLITTVRENKIALAFLKGILISLGVVAAAAAIAVLVAFAPLLITFGAIAAAASLIGLAIDELVVFLRGGETVLGAWAVGLDGMLKRFQQIADFIPLLGPFLRLLRAAGEGIADVFADSTFGTSAADREAAFQKQFSQSRGADVQQLGSPGRGGRRRKVTVRKGLTEFDPNANIAGFQKSALEQQNRDIRAAQAAGLATGTKSDQTNITTNVTVNASGVDPKGVVDRVKREVKSGIDRMLKQSVAGQPGVP